MIKPVAGDVPVGARSRTGRGDLAMNVLQYGTAIVAIIVVTLLGAVR